MKLISEGLIGCGQVLPTMGKDGQLQLMGKIGRSDQMEKCFTAVSALSVFTDTVILRSEILLEI